MLVQDFPPLRELLRPERHLMFPILRCSLRGFTTVLGSIPPLYKRYCAASVVAYGSLLFGRIADFHPAEYAASLTENGIIQKYDARVLTTDEL